MIYEFRCLDCGTVQEVWMKMSDPPPAKCTACPSTNLEKIISQSSFALKGSGWYTTDYKRSSQPKPKESSSESPSPTPLKSEEKSPPPSSSNPTPTKAGS